MLETYFFVPGDKKKYLDKIESLKADNIVIDLEDAVALQNKKKAFDLVLEIKPKKNFFVRIPFFDGSCYTEEQIVKLIQHFEGRIVVPKLKEVSELLRVEKYVSALHLKIIILIEDPYGFINLQEILKSSSKNIHAVGFGSHDFCSITGLKHTTEHLAHYKRQLILYTRAFNVNYIDGVDLNLDDFEKFKEECVFAFEIGARGKFLIHPKQIEELKNAKYLADFELKELKSVYDKVKNIPDDAIEVYTINGKVYEKPHIIRIKFLMSQILNNN